MVRRMRSVLHDWEYRLWDDADNERLVAAHFPRYLHRYRRIERGVVRADIARCMYLAVHGGFYFDTDYKILAPIDNQFLVSACVLPISRGAIENLVELRLGNAVMGSQPGYPFWTDFLSSLFAGDALDALAENKIEKTTGPEGLTTFFVEIAPDSPTSPSRHAKSFIHDSRPAICPTTRTKKPSAPISAGVPGAPSTFRAVQETSAPENSRRSNLNSASDQS